MLLGMSGGRYCNTESDSDSDSFILFVHEGTEKNIYTLYTIYEVSVHKFTKNIIGTRYRYCNDIGKIKVCI